MMIRDAPFVYMMPVDGNVLSFEDLMKKYFLFDDGTGSLAMNWMSIVLLSSVLANAPIVFCSVS